MKHSTIALGILSALTLAPAAEASLSGCTFPDQGSKQTQVYFANGINTKYADALIASDTLRREYKGPLEALEENSAYQFFPAYNLSQGFTTDVIQVFQQKMHEDPDGSIAYMVYDMLQAGLTNDAIRQTVAIAVTDGYLLAAALTDELLDELADTMAQISADAMKDLNRVNDLHSGLYADAMLNGKRVLIVAHSQGNLFTNTSVARVIDMLPNHRQSIGYFGVASPAAETVNGASYVTADDDRVIQLLRVTETVLPANIDNDPGVLNDHRDFLNHGFLESYLDGRLKSRERIDSGILQLANSLEYPELIAGEGAIRATLTWGDQPDVDLHVFEPGGAHVYYRNPQGNDGTLDVDDTNGFGPENYYVACNDVSEGSYRVGVNYFNGRGPETASVTLYLGNGTTFGPRQISLIDDRGSAGNDAPNSAFTLTVSDDGQGNALYSVE
ncbi:YfaP family protein [Ferrimonas futtsuensis]|uniref:YfaP family protein n=1 Tax=Ferrimonas futtsuensis TaxID=364764 RepID=UPI0004020F69|nr:hypothetical protein [Ferrimonas futtsuensis]